MPGKKGFARRVERVISSSDIVIEVLDARFPERTRNAETESRVLSSGKSLILLLNKSDLASARSAKRARALLSKTATCISVSSKSRAGGAKLRAAISRAAKHAAKAGQERLPEARPEAAPKRPKHAAVSIGIIGYPNTGKSSVINLLRGRHVAPTAQSAGFTRGEKLVRIAKGMVLIDTPGIIPMEERDECELALVCARSPNQLQDVEGCAGHIIKFVNSKNPNAFREAYRIPAGTAEAELLEKIAAARHRMKKGGVPDTYTAARLLIADWQQGRIRA